MSREEGGLWGGGLEVGGVRWWVTSSQMTHYSSKSVTITLTLLCVRVLKGQDTLFVHSCIL